MYYQLAQQEFESYLNGYDRENDRIKLKIIHTYGVVKQAEALAGRMHLSAEDTDLARLIALLHDIGRFEQLKRYDSFDEKLADELELLSAEAKFHGMTLTDFLELCQRAFNEMEVTAK